LWIKKATSLCITEFTLRFILVSIVQDDKELSTTYGKEKLPASFKEMERHGARITSYSYTTTEER
jgi:hypothetical protein